MTISKHEFLLRARLDQATLTAWIEEEWLVPRDPEAEFAEVDVARAQLIRDLKQDLDVNDAGIGVILGLVDQVHGLRRTLADLLAELRARRPGEPPA
jgi:chaperone modulatory protein CbpM